MEKPDALTLAAFAGFVLLGGANGTAIAITLRELAPFWSATLRFAGAALAFFVVALAGRRLFPHGRTLVGAALYGALGFFGTFALINWGLQFVRPGLAQILLALAPLVTLLLAVIERQEPFRPRVLAGGFVSLAGVLVVFRAQLQVAVPILGMLAIVAAAFSMAQGSLVAKRFPKADMATTNAIAMTVAATLFLALSLATREPRALPATSQSRAALLYLILAGSFVAFFLFLVVLRRWTASAAAFQWVALPLVAVPVSAFFTGEAVTSALLGGGVLVVVGVYVGAIWKPRSGTDAASARKSKAQ